MVVSINLNPEPPHRMKMGDFWIQPLYEWNWDFDTSTTIKKFRGWYAWTIDERGLPGAPCPFTGQTLGGQPHNDGLFASPEEAYAAALKATTGEVMEPEKAVPASTEDEGQAAEAAQGDAS